MKNGIIFIASNFSCWVLVLKLFQKKHFLQFCADLCKKPEPVKAIYICASESSHYTLSEYDIVYRGWTTVNEILETKISKNDDSTDI